ncbi:UDP-glycosyltransferase UGT5-like isoform X4 [Onthophagus taurus]|uniref:UDP-glycosyltransferase UGT5-like isoform X4 n=1 Tax=Onthophagus taurus TaxID=166361 RepID=UPI0039BDDF03
MLVLPLFLIFLNFVNSLKILTLLPHAGKSHFVAYESILRELANKGHEVHVYSEFPQKVPLPRYKDFVLEKVHQNSTEIINMKDLPGEFWTQHIILQLLAQFAQKACQKLDQKIVKDLLKSMEKYDLILIEYFNTDCFLGFAHIFKIPFIALSSSYPMPWYASRFSRIDNPAFVPVLFGNFAKHMSFSERLQNTIMLGYCKSMYYLLYDVPGNRRAKAFFGDDLPPLEKIAENTSLMLVNNHVTLNGAFPQVPGMIEVGGVHLRNPENLPKNIEKWINESSEGVVYFSMGSMLIGHSFPIKKREMFQRAFSRLKHRVLWKWENDTMPGKPDNVMTQKWMPQFDILCHPNVKAFVAHGGLLGMTEAVHCGVPVVVMPQFGDQFTNARALEASGGGVILDFSTITEDNVYEALQKVLNPKFKKQAEELSARFKDRPMSPMDTAIYWIEYVARHKGAPHLKTAAVGMPFYQYLLLDVIAFLLVVFLSICLVSYYTLKMLLKCVYPAKVKKTKTN